MELVIFSGIQGSGKSLFFADRFADTHVRINLDMLNTRFREKTLFEACVVGKAKTVIDNTNPSKEDRKRYIVPALDAGFKVIGYSFGCPLKEALMRNAARERVVPEIGLRDVIKRMEPMEANEGIHEAYDVELRDDGFHTRARWIRAV